VKEKCKWKKGGEVAQWTKIPKDLKITKHPHYWGVRLHPDILLGGHSRYPPTTYSRKFLGVLYAYWRR
jgi:hypothetical protein